MQGDSGAISASGQPETRGAGILLALAAAAVSLLPARGPWSALIGHPLGETDNHLWMFWMASRRVLGDGRALANAPEGIPIPLMDPINLPPFLALWPLGPYLAWNAVLAWCALVALAGGALLAREVAGEEAAPVGAVALVSAPFLAGVVDFGITESWTVGYFALHAGALLRHARTGETRWAVVAGASLGAIALSGWYHALFGVILEIMLVPWLLLRHRRPGTVLQGFIGLACGIPPLLRFLPNRDYWAGRWHAPSRIPGPRWPDWDAMPRFGTDLLNLAIPRWDVLLAPSKSVYLGVVLLLLVARGLWVQPRKAAPMVLLALPFLALALGHWPRVGGEAIGLRGPAWWLATYFPSLQGLSHWHRAVGAAIPFLAAAAAVGAADLARRRAGLVLVCGLLLADAVAFARTAWPRSTIVADVPEALYGLGDAGAARAGVIQLPFDNGRVEFQPVPARLYNQWQVFHQHPVSESYESADSLLLESRLVSAADGACGHRFTGPRDHAPIESRRRAAVTTDPAELKEEVGALRGWGYRWLVLHEDRAVTAERARVAIEAALGPGRRVERTLVWDLDAWAAEHGPP